MENKSLTPCPICYDYKNDNEYFTLPCTHKICLKCINEWSNEKKECPICKTPFQYENNQIQPSLNQMNYYPNYQPQYQPQYQQSQYQQPQYQQPQYQYSSSQYQPPPPNPQSQSQPQYQPPPPIPSPQYQSPPTIPQPQLPQFQPPPSTPQPQFQPSKSRSIDDNINSDIIYEEIIPPELKSFEKTISNYLKLREVLSPDEYSKYVIQKYEEEHKNHKKYDNGKDDRKNRFIERDNRNKYNNNNRSFDRNNRSDDRSNGGYGRSNRNNNYRNNKNNDRNKRNDDRNKRDYRKDYMNENPISTKSATMNHSYFEDFEDKGDIINDNSRRQGMYDDEYIPHTDRIKNDRNIKKKNIPIYAHPERGYEESNITVLKYNNKYNRMERDDYKKKYEELKKEYEELKKKFGILEMDRDDLDNQIGKTED